MSDPTAAEVLFPGLSEPSRPIRSGDRIATGTGPDRRRLTQAEAEAGGLPEPFTKDEWAAMAQASRGEPSRVVFVPAAEGER